MQKPVKPFDSYKWRWLSVQPSEGLLDAPVFLGVLRALADFEGQRFSSEELFERLNQVQQETRSSVTLARDPARNLFRNSGQYWRGTGLIRPTSGIIELTDLGRRVSSGDITRDDFAALMVRNTVLPNPLTYRDSEVGQWQSHELKIRPLELILEILTFLHNSYPQEHTYLATNELIKIVIPLAGAKLPVKEICDAIVAYRNNELDISDWPDCAPEANDKRLAREFLLFLKNFEILTIKNPEAPNDEHQYALVDTSYVSMGTEVNIEQIIEDSKMLDEEIDVSRHSSVPNIIERTRVTTSIIRRSRQASFRKEVLQISSNKCLLSNEVIPDVLEAAHIIPVNSGGSDVGENGICLRVDLHRLYDGGKIRILECGNILYNKQVLNSVNYKTLPQRVEIPNQINRQNLIWREKYL